MSIEFKPFQQKLLNNLNNKINSWVYDSVGKTFIVEFIKKNYDNVILFNGFNSYIYMFICRNKYNIVIFDTDIEYNKYLDLQKLLNLSNITVIVCSNNKPIYNLNNISLISEKNDY